ncbi:MAG: dihydrofolate reductase family protein [Omnitrophica WOR_2 bacterium]
MGKVTTGFSMSLDGFIAGPNDEVDRLFQWYFSGDATHEVASGNEVYKMSEEGAGMIQEASQVTGVLVTARRTFNIAHAWGGKHPLDVPVVVVTHRIPQEWVKVGSPFTFVTDGIESAIEKAKQIAGDKTVAVGAPSVVQQCLQAGLLDEIHIDLVPVLLFNGIRLFDHLSIKPVDLEILEVTANLGVTHLTYRVVK